MSLIKLLHVSVKKIVAKSSVVLLALAAAPNPIPLLQLSGAKITKFCNFDAAPA
jgi:hypothetical protein